MLDSAVLIGLVDPTDGHHRSASAAIEDARGRGHDFVLAASVLAESLVGAYRASQTAGDDLAADLVAAFGPTRAVDEDVALAAARLRARRPGLRLPDALVIATAVVENGIALTCDRRLGSVDERVRVIGPD